MSDAELVHIPMGGGLDESNEDTFVSAPAMRVCDNVVFPDGNVAVKRQGLRLAATIANARKLIEHAGALLAIDGVNAMTIDAAGGVHTIGAVSPCSVARSEALGGSVQAATNSVAAFAPLVSVADGNGYRIRLVSNGTVLSASVEDGDGVFRRPLETLDAAAGDGTPSQYNQPRVVIVGTTAIALYFKSSTTALRAATLDLTNLAAGWSAISTLQTATGGAPCAFDASAITGGSSFATIFCNNSGGADTIVGTIYSAALSALHSATIDIIPWNFNGWTSFVLTSCAVRGVLDDDAVAFAYSYKYFDSLGSLNVTVVNAASSTVSTLTPLLAPSLVAQASGTSTGQFDAVGLARRYGFGVTSLLAQWVVTYTQFQQIAPASHGGAAGASVTFSTWFTYWKSFQSTAAGSPTGNFLLSAFGPIQAAQIMSKPFEVFVAGVLHIYLLCLISDHAQPTSILYDLPIDRSIDLHTPALPVAVSTPRFAAANASFPGPRAADVTGGGVATLTSYTTSTTVAVQTTTTSATLLTYDFADKDLWQTVSMGGWTWIAGGLPMLFDGSRITEAGFVQAPPPPALRNEGSGGALPQNVLYSYVIVYSQVDDNGNVHRSAPSAPSALTTLPTGGSAQVIYLEIVPYRGTYRQTFMGFLQKTPYPVMIEIYRTTQTTPGIFQLLAIIPNDVADLDTIPFTDGIVDATIAGNPILYSTGAVPALATPALSALCVHADRVMGIGEDGRTMYFTTQYVPGEAPRFSAGFTIAWPEGPITATWSLEQRLHAATEDAIFYIIGEGPADSGVGVDWTTPNEWQSDMGVIDSRGLADCSMGQIISTSKGIYLEGRDGSFTWVGRKIQRTLKTYPIVTGIAVLETDGVVRFTLKASDTDGAAGKTLHWDMRNDRWSTHTYLGSAGFEGIVLAGGAATSLVRVTFGGVTNGGVLVEDDMTNLDPGSSWIPITIATGWFELAGKQGSERVQRVLLLAQAASPHGISIVTARDYSATWDTDAGTWTDAQIAAMPSEQVRHTPTVQKAMAVSVKITDAAPTTIAVGTGAGPTLLALSIRGRPRRGEWKQFNSGQQR